MNFFCTILSLFCLPVFGQIEFISPFANEITFDYTMKYSCDSYSDIRCGTFSNPKKGTLIVGNYPDSLQDENYIYSILNVKLGKDTVRLLHKIPMDRYIFYVTHDILMDSFVTELDGTLVQFTHSPSGHNIRVIKEGLRIPFSLDIQIPGLNVMVSRDLNKRILLSYRE